MKLYMTSAHRRTGIRFDAGNVIVAYGLDDRLMICYYVGKTALIGNCCLAVGVLKSGDICI